MFSVHEVLSLRTEAIGWSRCSRSRPVRAGEPLPSIIKRPRFSPGAARCCPSIHKVLHSLIPMAGDMLVFASTSH